MSDYTNKHIVAAILAQAYAATVPGFFGPQQQRREEPVKPDERKVEKLGHLYAEFLKKVDTYTGWGTKVGGA